MKATVHAWRSSPDLVLSISEFLHCQPRPVKHFGRRNHLQSAVFANSGGQAGRAITVLYGSYNVAPEMTGCVICTMYVFLPAAKP